jgi:hypothetical protein
MKDLDEQLWTIKGQTLSDKLARKEYKLTQDEIIEGIKKGKLHYRVNYVYDNPWYRLLRSEIEKFVIETHGLDHLQENKFRTELIKIEKDLKGLKSKILTLEMQKNDLKSKLDKKNESII